MASSDSFMFRLFLRFILGFSIKLNFLFHCWKGSIIVPLLCVCVNLPGKAVPKMAYTVSGLMLNPTYSLTHSFLRMVCEGNNE